MQQFRSGSVVQGNDTQTGLFFKLRSSVLSAAMPISQLSQRAKAILDIKRGLAMYSLWGALAWLDTKQRYRRSLLGPFWITLSTGVMVAGMGPLYGALLGQPVGNYVQHLAISLILWTFISSSVNDAGTVFIGAESYIKQVPLPLSVFVFRGLAKNLIMLAHNALIIVVVLYVFPPATLKNLWMVPIGLVLIIANLFWFTLLLGVLSTRFRDIPQLIANIVQVAFFLSPILWRPEMLSPRVRFLSDFNPLYHFMEIVRAPLLAEPIRLISWAVAAGLLVVGFGLTLLAFTRFRSRVAYWL
jgi:ABC-type polysaccharide/polyol phosphate export permease